MDKTADAIVVGAGPNGLAGAIELARAGLRVHVIEGAATVGGGARSAELTLPGYVHDVCSAVYPMAVASTFFNSLPLADHGLEWIHPKIPLAHPLDDGTAAVLFRSVEETAGGLGADGRAYRKLMQPLVDSAAILFKELVGPIRIPPHPFTAMKFGLPALRSGRGLAEAYFRNGPARALFAGLAAHAVLPLEKRGGAAVGLMLALAGHAVGWPIVRGGSQRLSDALASYLRTLGGTIETGRTVRSLDELPTAKIILMDVAPRNLIAIAGNRMPEGYRRSLAKFRHGPGVCKVDWALADPIPWAAKECRAAGTVHVGGRLDEIALSEAAPWKGDSSPRPFLLVGQPTIDDPSRAPAGKHTAWGYCHVPHGSTEDMSERIESQIERFAPGFRDLILARHTMNAMDFEGHNPNLIGGDVIGGAGDLWQLFARPVARLNPYATPMKGVYLCSASTPPGAGVHGLCGYFAARAALRKLR